METVFCIAFIGYWFFTFCIGPMFIVLGLACYTEKFPFLTRNVKKVRYVFCSVVALSWTCLITVRIIICI